MNSFGIRSADKPIEDLGKVLNINERTPALSPKNHESAQKSTLRPLSYPLVSYEMQGKNIIDQEPETASRVIENPSTKQRGLPKSEEEQREPEPKEEKTGEALKKDSVSPTKKRRFKPKEKKRKSFHLGLQVDWSASSIETPENFFEEIATRLCGPDEKKSETLIKKSALAEQSKDIYNCLSEINAFLSKFVQKSAKGLPTDYIATLKSENQTKNFQHMSEPKKLEYLAKRKLVGEKQIKIMKRDLEFLQKRQEQEKHSAQDYDQVFSQITDLKDLVASEKKEVFEMKGEARNREKTFLNAEKLQTSSWISKKRDILNVIAFLKDKTEQENGKMTESKLKVSEIQEKIKEANAEKEKLEAIAIEMGAKKTEEGKRAEELQNRKEKLEKFILKMQESNQKFEEDKRFELTPFSDKNSEVLEKIKKMTEEIKKQRQELNELTEFVNVNKSLIAMAASKSDANLSNAQKGKKGLNDKNHSKSSSKLGSLKNKSQKPDLREPSDLKKNKNFNEDADRVNRTSKETNEIKEELAESVSRMENAMKEEFSDEKELV